MNVITNKAGHGEQITLRCKNHPHLRWQTKNIDYIGARKIFYDLFRECDEPECNCPASDLEVLP